NRPSLTGRTPAGVRPVVVLGWLERVAVGFGWSARVGCGPPLAHRKHLRKGRGMSDTTCHMSISLDGFVAGPDQSRDDPLGKRGHDLHRWHMGDKRAAEADTTAAGWLMRPRGAY